MWSTPPLPLSTKRPTWRSLPSASVSVQGKLQPAYSYGLMTPALPGWSVGTFLGVALGNLFPANVLSALSVGLYGMFTAIFIPPAKKNKVVLVLVIISFALSFLFGRVITLGIPEGVRTILLTVVISLAAALLFPITEKEEQTDA